MREYIGALQPNSVFAGPQIIGPLWSKTLVFLRPTARRLVESVGADGAAVDDDLHGAFFQRREFDVETKAADDRRKKHPFCRIGPHAVGWRIVQNVCTILAGETAADLDVAAPLQVDRTRKQYDRLDPGCAFGGLPGHQWTRLPLSG